MWRFFAGSAQPEPPMDFSPRSPCSSTSEASTGPLLLSNLPRAPASHSACSFFDVGLLLDADGVVLFQLRCTPGSHTPSPTPVDWQYRGRLPMRKAYSRMHGTEPLPTLVCSPPSMSTCCSYHMPKLTISISHQLLNCRHTLECLGHHHLPPPCSECRQPEEPYMPTWVAC